MQRLVVSAIIMLYIQVDHLAEYMRAQDHTVSTIHSDLTPEERKRIMKVSIIMS